MRSMGMKWTVFGLATAILLLGSVRGQAGEAKSSPYTSAKVCAGCHEDIYQMWSRSLHATALTDPVFDVVYMQVLKATDGKARESCLRCHTPTTRVSRDFALRHEVTREGVTCDFCHTISVVNMDMRTEPYTMRPGSVKFGPLGDTTSPGHLTTFSAVHEKSELCGGCHELATKNGTVIMGKNSPLMHATSSLVLNAIKKLADIPDKIHLLSPSIIDSIKNLKKDVLASRSVSLDVEEALIALSISATTNPAAQEAMEKLKELKGCEVHLTHMPTSGDEAGLRKLGVNLTS